MFDLDHADVLLALVVGEGDVGIDQERENAQVVIFQAIQQVCGFALLGTPFSLPAAGMFPAAFAHDGPVAGMPPV